MSASALSGEQLETSRELAEELRAAEALATSSLDAQDVARAELEALPDGVHYDVPERVYHARSPLFASKSILDLVARSPRRYAAWLAGALRGETKALRFGKAIHMAILEPAQFVQTYVLEPVWGPLRKTDACSSEEAKANKTRREEWRKAHEGAVILEGAEAIATLGMVRAVAAHEHARSVLEGGRSEVTLVWTDRETGLRCKARVDSLLEDVPLPGDIKSTLDAREASFSRSFDDYGYYRQAPFYLDGLVELGFEVDDDHFAFVAVEKDGAHDLSVWYADPDDVAVGRSENRAALRLLAECRASGRFPGYVEDIRRISRPAWRRRRAS